MIKPFTVKFMSFVVLLSIHSSFAVADSKSALAQLPFGIEIGQTKNEEIENRGVCVGKIRVTDSYFRCQNYDMLNGKFVVQSSQNEIVSNIYFSALKRHSLPQNWQKLGLRLSPPFEYLEPYKGATVGSSADELIRLINSINVDNKDVRVIDKRLKYGSGEVLKIVSFDIGNNHYEAIFQTEYAYSPSKYDHVQYERGLVSLEITEAY